MADTCYCKKCGLVKDIKEFYMSRNVEKYPPDGRLNICKACLTMHVDNWDPTTFVPILKEIDVPYVKDEWDKLLTRYATEGKKITGLTILGRYLSKMRLKEWKDYRFEDSERIEQEALEKKVFHMKAQGLSDEEIVSQLKEPRLPPKPTTFATEENADAPDKALATPRTEEDDIFESQLTEEDKMRLRLKWGSEYRAEEWVKMEQLYEDMMQSYDIQGAGHKDTLIMICKASLKANQLIDSGDKLLCPHKIF